MKAKDKPFCLVKGEEGKLQKKDEPKYANLDCVRYENGKIHVLESSDFRRGDYQLPTIEDLEDDEDCEEVFLNKGIGHIRHTTLDAKTKNILREKVYVSDHGLGLFNASLLSLIGVGIPFLAYQLLGSPAKKRKEYSAYKNQREKFWDANYKTSEKKKKEKKNKSKGIRFYQGSKEEVEKELGVKLKLVDTGCFETFLEEEYASDLQYRAQELGADAIIHYQTSFREYDQLVIGTPVKIIKKNGKKR